jgi:hypothetical protein
MGQECESYCVWLGLVTFLHYGHMNVHGICSPIRILRHVYWGKGDSSKRGDREKHAGELKSMTTQCPTFSVAKAKDGDFL